MAGIFLKTGQDGLRRSFFTPMGYLALITPSQAIDISSAAKGEVFANKVFSKDTPVHHKQRIYVSYEKNLRQSAVDIVFVGRPHALYKVNCLAAIYAGKNVLCEKLFTVNERETAEMISRVREKGMLIIEALWTRFSLLNKDLKRFLHEDNIIGEAQRIFCDLALSMNMSSLPAASRLKYPALEAGPLLETIRVYTLIDGTLALDGNVGKGQF